MGVDNADYVALLQGAPAPTISTDRTMLDAEQDQLQAQGQSGGDFAGQSVELKGSPAKGGKGGLQASISSLASRILQRKDPRGQSETAQRQSSSLLLWGPGRPLPKPNPETHSPRSPLKSTTLNEQALWQPPETKPLPEEGQILALTIHQAQPLVPEPRLTSPVVRLHCVDRTTGQYLKKTDAARPAVTPNEACDYVMPLQTKPFDLKQRGRGGILCASWEECLLLDEEAVRFFGPDALLLLEVLQLPTSASKQKRGRLAGGAPAWKVRDGYYRVAWAYLSPQSSLGQPHLGQVSLQLYYYAPPPRFQGRDAPEVFTTWQRLCDARLGARARRKRARRLLYPAAITVTLAAVPRPQEATVVAAPQVGVRGLLANQIESGRLAAEDLLQEWQEKNHGAEHGRMADPSGTALTEEDLGKPPHTRAHHEPCIVPTVPQHRLTTGSRGCVRVQFSPSGRFLAVIASEALLFPLQVFSAHSGALLATFQGHQSLVYDLSWASDDTSLLTASSDFTAKLWDFSPAARTGRPGAALKQPGAAAGGPSIVFQHPCYVYGAAFYPTALAPRLVASAAFDGHVRIWDRDSGEILRQVPLHKTHINALVFDNVGKRLFTGDGSGHVTECSCDFSPGGAGVKPLRTSTELGGEPVTCLRLHPSGRRLFVLARRNRLVGIDSRLFTVDRRYKGMRCQDHPVAFDVSPDGRYLVSGSEDGRPYMWQVDSGAVFSPFPPLLLRSEAVYDCAWNPVEHTVAVAAVGTGSPALIFCPDPSLVQQFEPQASLSAPFDPTPTGTTFVMSPDAPLPAELRQMTRNGRSFLPDKFTPDKIKEMLSTLRAADTQRLTITATRADANLGQPKDQGVTWRAGLELREHLEVAQSENEGREHLEGTHEGRRREEGSGNMRSEHSDVRTEGRAAERRKDGVQDYRAERQKGSAEVGGSWGGKIHERSKINQSDSDDLRTDIALFGQQKDTDGAGFSDNATAGGQSIDSTRGSEDELRLRRRSSSDASSVADVKTVDKFVITLNPGDIRNDSPGEKERRLLERRRSRNKWMEFRSEGDGTERNWADQAVPADRLAGDGRNQADSGTGSKDAKKERKEGIERGLSQDQVVHSVEGIRERQGQTATGSVQDGAHARTESGRVHERRLSKSKSGKRRESDRRNGTNGERNEIDGERNVGQVATLRRISSRLKKKLSLSGKETCPDPEEESDGVEKDGQHSDEWGESLRRAKSLERRRSGEDGGGMQKRVRSVEVGGGKGEAGPAAPGVTRRLAKVLDPRERIKARLERQRSRGAPV